MLRLTAAKCQISHHTHSNVLALSSWLTTVGGAQFHKRLSVEPSVSVNAHLAYRTKRTCGKSPSASSTQAERGAAAAGCLERGLIAKEPIPEGSLIFSTPLSACLSVPTYPVAVLEPRHPSHMAFVAQYPAFASIPHPLRFYAAFREMLAAFNAYTEQMDVLDEGHGGTKKDLIYVTDRELEYVWLGCIIGATMSELQRAAAVRQHPASIGKRGGNEAEQEEAISADFYKNLPFSFLISTFPTDTAPFVEAMQFYSESSASPLHPRQRALLTQIHNETLSILDMAAEVCADHQRRGASLRRPSTPVQEGGGLTRSHIEWGFRQAVSRATILPFRAPTAPLDVGSWMEGISESELVAAAVHPAIIPVVDMLNHPPRPPAQTGASSRALSGSLPVCSENSAVLVCTPSASNTSNAPRKRNVKTGEVIDASDPEMEGVTLYDDPNEIELDGLAPAQQNRVPSSSQDLTVVLLSTQRIPAESEIFVEYDIPLSSASSSSEVADEEVAAAIYKFGFAEA